MGTNFKRNPSKVWWASESVEWYEISRSPGSLDSGYSDAEASPPLPLNETTQLNADLQKSSSDEDQPRNLSSSYKEKNTPDKSFNLDKTLVNASRINRNLFSDVKQEEDDQYATGVVPQTENHHGITTLSNSWSLAEGRRLKWRSKSLNHYVPSSANRDWRLNRTTPVILQKFCEDEEDRNEDTAQKQEDEQEVSFTRKGSLSSDCESELECLFIGSDSPKHTSTPVRILNQRKMMLRPQSEHRVPPIYSDNEAVYKWLNEVKQIYEPECMTTLQAKSILAELNAQVNSLAAVSTQSIIGILAKAKIIETEYNNLNCQEMYLAPLTQSLAGNIVDFFKTYPNEINLEYIEDQYDKIQKLQQNESLQLLSNLFNIWKNVQHDLLVNDARMLVEKVENPQTDLMLRATVTGLTSLALQNNSLAEIFCRFDAVQILLIQCEKCQGSSIRVVLLRALATICTNAEAVHKFEKVAGLHLVADVLEDRSRPEPERSEAVSLLVQVTSPWIENGFCLRGLQDCAKRIITGLTYFTQTTQCCQNLLLCTAALANLATMDQRCINYMLHVQTVNTLLANIEQKASCNSPYLLEQTAGLITNMASLDVARCSLIECRAPQILFNCLQWQKGTNWQYQEVAKRIQQKAIIGLSKLCGTVEAASQIVQMGGIERLVKMCRDKRERFDNDSILVATLATLRKISHACGQDVLNNDDSLELVQPKLVDSFLTYSTQSESYV